MKTNTKQLSDIEFWAHLVNEAETKAGSIINEPEVLTLLAGSLLVFMNGEGEKVLKDSEWMEYLIDDITALSNARKIHLTSEDESRLRQIKNKQYI